MIIKEGKFLGDLIGAHDVGDFATIVELVSPTSPALHRGSVTCKLANGMVTLAGAELSTPADVYGIVLELNVDPTTPEAFASIARNGTFNATMLEIDPSVKLADFEVALREKGIFLEQLALVP